MKKRLKALEEKVAKEGVVLTESQLEALERKKDDDLAHGVIETHHPGYLGSQDTFYVGTIKGVGRIYQQTFVGTYSKVAWCSFITPKLHLQQQTYSMIECFQSLKDMEWGFLESLLTEGQSIVVS